MDAINQLVSVDTQAMILQYLLLAGLAVPFLEKLATIIPGEWDNIAVTKFKAFLSVVGTILPGPGGLKK